MDQLLTFLGTLVAVALGGFVSQRNERRRLAHEAELERARWERDRKVEAYASFLTAYNRFRVVVWDYAGLDAPWSEPLAPRNERDDDQWKRDRWQNVRDVLDDFAPHHAVVRLMSAGPTGEAATKMLGPLVEPIVLVKAGKPLSERQEKAD